MRQVLIFGILIVCALGCYAAIYMHDDQQGNVTYTDMPSGNAQVINAGEGNTVSAQDSTPPTAAIAPAPTNAVVTTEVASNQPYEAFSISSPSDQESIQNQPTIRVKLDIKPELQNGDTVQLYVDGTPWGAPSKSGEIAINQLERGTHQLSAKLLDPNNRVLKETKTITIFVHRASSNFTPS